LFSRLPKIRGEYFSGYFKEEDMALQGLNSYNSPSNLGTSFNDRSLKPSKDTGLRNSSARSSLKAAVISESYSSEKFEMEFTSKDGDNVSFSYESIQFQKKLIEIEAEGNPEDMKKLVSYIKKQFDNMKQNLIDTVINGHNGNSKKNKVEDLSESNQIEIPEYWNAENTSQRIVDFSTSFFGAFEGSGEEYLSKIKTAIEDGFKQAKEILGNLPDSVSNLIGDTFDLAMEKLNSWAESQGISVGEKVAA
jgi:hypothetical protein